MQRSAILLALAAATLAGMQPAAADPQAPESAPRVERVADGVYAIIHPDATADWVTGNTGVIVGDDGVLVVDAGYLPSIAREDIALIKTLTDKPVRYLVYTHWHFDHNNGGSAYKAAFPGIRIVSERSTARYIDVNSNWWKRMWTGPGSPALEELRELDSRLRSGLGADGRPLAAAQLEELRRDIRQRDREQQELASLEVVVPDLVFDSSLPLTLGSRRVELTNRGQANSPADTTVYVPDAQVLFTGDIVVQSPLPFTRYSWPLAWIDVLKGLESTPARSVVPGHGPVLSGTGYVTQVRVLLENAATEVERLTRGGMTLDQIQKTVTLADVRARVPEWRDPSLDARWKEMVDTLLERTWRAVRGQG